MYFSYWTGRGNSAFEVAQGIYGVTNTVNMVSRSQTRLAWSTHYVGDLRYAIVTMPFIIIFKYNFRHSPRQRNINM